MDESVTTDQQLAVVAARQYGVVAVRQLGFSKDAIASRQRAGRLHPLHRGVYAVGHRPTARESRWLAAVLACGEGAVLSHRSAATLWRIRDGEGPRPDVTSAARRRHAGVEGHRGRLHENDRDEHLGIPVTSPARTLADLAHVLSLDDLVRAFREAQFLRLYDRKALQDALTRRPSTRLKELMEDAAITQSEMEEAFKRICLRHRIPMPQTQYRLGAKTYDFAWPEHRLIVEADSWLAHGTPYAFQADRTTSNQLQLKGWMILRFTWKDVTKRSRRVATEVKDALRARSEPSGPPRRPPRPRPATAAS